MQMPDKALQCTLLKVRAGGGPILETILDEEPLFQVAGSYDHAVFHALPSTDADTSFLVPKTDNNSSLQFDQILNVVLYPIGHSGDECAMWFAKARRETRVVLMVFMSAAANTVISSMKSSVESLILDKVSERIKSVQTIGADDFRLSLTLGHPGVFAFLRTQPRGEGIRKLLVTAANFRTLLTTPNGNPLLHKTLTTVLLPQPLPGGEGVWVNDRQDKVGALVQISGSSGMRRGAIDEIRRAVGALQDKCLKSGEEGQSSQESSGPTLDTVFGDVDVLLRIPDEDGKRIPFPILMAKIKEIRDKEAANGTYDYYHTATVPVLGNELPIIPEAANPKIPRLEQQNSYVDQCRLSLLKTKSEPLCPESLKPVVHAFVDRFASYVQATTAHAFLDMFPFAAGFSQIMNWQPRGGTSPDDVARMHDIIVNANLALEQRYETLERHLVGAPYTPTIWTLGLTKAMEAIGAIPSFLIQNLPQELPDAKRNPSSSEWRGFVVVGQGSQFRWLQPDAMAVPASALSCPITNWTALGHETAHIMYGQTKWNAKKTLHDSMDKTRREIYTRLDTFAPDEYFEEMAEEIFAYLFDYYYCYGGRVVDTDFPLFLKSAWTAIGHITDLSSKKDTKRQEHYLFKLFCAYLGAQEQGNELWGSRNGKRLGLLSDHFGRMLEMFKDLPEGNRPNLKRDVGRAIIFKSASFVPLIETIKMYYLRDDYRGKLQKEYPALGQHVKSIGEGQVVTGIENPLRLMYDLHKKWIASSEASPVSLKENLALLVSLAHYHRQQLLEGIQAVMSSPK